MADSYPEPLFLDTTVTSNFASTDGCELLARTLDSSVVTPAVQDEIGDGCAHGHEYLTTAVAAIGNAIPIRTVPESAPDQPTRIGLDAGEAEPLQGAIATNGTITTDDLAARRAAKRQDVPVTGSVGLLVHSVSCGSLSQETADDWLTTWRDERGYYAPVDSISEIL
jgi:Predicted nucleic acid-binding protein, contains PIN domain